MIKHVDTKKNILYKGEYICSLSNKLCGAIALYLNHRENWKKDDPLFINIAEQEQVCNSTFLNQHFLKNISKTDISGLIKYRINKFKEQNLPTIVIKEFTGVTDRITSENEEIEYVGDYEILNQYFEKLKI